jgi:multidrug efflux system membrane fusion protein
MNEPQERREAAHSEKTRPTAPEKHSFPWLMILIVIFVIGGIVGLVMYRRAHGSGESQKGGKGGKGGGQNVPVAAVLGVVTQKDFSIFLDGLGTVQAFNTVTVKTRVDGEVRQIAFDEGQDVKKGDLLAQIDPRPYQTLVDQAIGKKGQDEANLANAQIDLKRNEVLLANKIVAQEVYDTAKALVNQLQAAVKADDAAIESAQVQLDYSRITAPINGRTGIRQVDVGNIVRAGDSNSIVVLAQLKPIALVFTLPEQNLGEIQKQQTKSPLTVVALDRDNKSVLDTGKLSVIDNEIDTTTGTIRLKATFPNSGLNLWPGQFVNARLLLSIETNAIVVPASVVQRGPDGAYAFIVGDDSHAQMAPLKVGKIDLGEAWIQSGLEAGQKVVVDGQYKLQPGSLVKSAEPQGTNAIRKAGSQGAKGGTNSWQGKKSGKNKASE